jgi:hypothetical protein
VLWKAAPLARDFMTRTARSDNTLEVRAMGSRCHYSFRMAAVCAHTSHLLLLQAAGSHRSSFHGARRLSNGERTKSTHVEGVNGEIREQTGAGTTGAPAKASSVSGVMLRRSACSRGCPQNCHVDRGVSGKTRLEPDVHLNEPNCGRPAVLANRR